MKTDTKALQTLFDSLADTMRDVLENGKAVTDKETGELVRVTPDASTLNVIRQFLKDNQIDAVAKAGSPLGKLADSLPFTGVPTADDEDGYPLN